MSKLYDLAADEYETFVINQRFKNPAKETANIINELAHQDSKLLDVGTGSGIVLSEIRQLNPHLELFGLDNSFEVLELARKKGFELLIKSSLPNLPFLDNSFDFVTANFVLSHIDQYEKTIQEISRIIVPNGYFVFTSWGSGQKEYNKLFYNKVIDFISPEEHDRIIKQHLPNEELFEDNNSLTNILSKNNFKITKQYTKQYQLDLTLSDYLNCRFNLLIGKHMKKVLSPTLWEQFQQEMSAAFQEKVGQEITYKGNVDFFICKLESQV